MKKTILLKLMPIFVLIWAGMISTSWAALVVTDEIRLWARKVVSEEHSLDSISAANTVAVLDFYNKTQLSELNLVQKGIALMLITDLSKIKDIQLLERSRLKAICDELELSRSSLVEEGTRSRLGKLLGARCLVGGDITSGGTDKFELNSVVLKVANAHVLGQASAQGRLIEGIFEMEKKILFDIIKELKIELSPWEVEMLKRPLTDDLEALLNLFRALEYSDEGNLAKALQYIKKSLERDPDFELAVDFLTEITGLIGAEGYSSAGYLTTVASDNKGDGHDPVEQETVDPEPEQGNFRYYGKAYDLDSGITVDDPDDTSGSSNGIIWFGEPQDMFGRSGITTPFLTPFYSGGGLDSPIVSKAVVSRKVMSNVAMGTYSWQVSQQLTGENGNPPANVTAKLFENTDNPIIVLDYYNDPDVVSSFGGYLDGGMAALHPGAELPGNPGENDPFETSRDYSTGIDALRDAIDDTPLHLHESVPAAEVPYTSMCNINEVPSPIPVDIFQVLMPDRWDTSNDRGPTYSVTSGGRNLVVDSDSVDQALNELIDDKEAFDTAMDGEFSKDESTYKDYEGHIGDLLPGIYEAEDALNGLKNDGMLAYIFKYEEYLVNKEIVKNSNISNTLKAQLMAGSANAIASIRDLDAALEEMSDAKANFVQKDIHGNWVRTQQWMLRPNNTQIQMLNITHRGSGPLKGSSGMDFSAFLTEAYSTNLSAKDLPWDSWLATRTNKSGVRYIENSSKAPELESMYVKMFNPTGEFIKEERSFDSRVDERQVISNEELTLANEGNINNPAMYTFDKGLSFDNNEYRVDSGVGKFNYVFGDSSINSIEVAFFAVGDGANNGNNYQYSNDIHDIWDALRVNSQHGPEIGENNLEIVVDATRNGDRKYNYFVNPIDVIYVPMNRMIWKAKEEPVS